MSPTSYQTALSRVALSSIELNLGKCQGVCNIPLHLPSDQRLILTFHGGEILNYHGHIVDIDAGGGIIGEGMLKEILVIPLGKILAGVGPSAFLTIEGRGEDNFPHHHETL